MNTPQQREPSAIASYKKLEKHLSLQLQFQLLPTAHLPDNCGLKRTVGKELSTGNTKVKLG